MVAVYEIDVPLALLHVVQEGMRDWAKYGIVQGVPELLPRVNVVPIATIAAIAAITTITPALLFLRALRARRVLGVVPLSALARHMVVLGPTGSGKTTVAKEVIAKAVKKGIKMTVIDWKGEYVSYLKGASVVRKINIWDVPGETAEEKALYAVEMIREMSKDVAEVSPASATLLLRTMVKLYEKGIPTTSEVIRELTRAADLASIERRYAEANMYLALIRRLYVLLIDEERPAVNVRGSDSVVVYDLSQLPSVYLKSAYAIAILVRKYKDALKGGLKARLGELIVAEEAQNYIRPRTPDEPPTVGERIVYELRGFGVGVVLICPDPELMPIAITKDVGAIVVTSPDSLPRFVLERFLFRASLEEAEKMWKKLIKAKLIIYDHRRLHLRRLPKPKPIKLMLTKPTVTEEVRAEEQGEEVEEGEVSAPETPTPSLPEGVEVEGRVEEAEKGGEPAQPPEPTGSVELKLEEDEDFEEEADVSTPTTPSEAPSRGTASLLLVRTATGTWPIPWRLPWGKAEEGAEMTVEEETEEGEEVTVEEAEKVEEETPKGSALIAARGGGVFV
ncbi:MAG: DUF87 domain-containing protein [Aigarchaeota archaeon]|nr:DUF87 domain-containing protein [Candidatus Calditenuis fumarioli]